MGVPIIHGYGRTTPWQTIPLPAGITEGTLDWRWYRGYPEIRCIDIKWTQTGHTWAALTIPVEARPVGYGSRRQFALSTRTALKTTAQVTVYEGGIFFADTPSSSMCGLLTWSV